MRASVFVLEAVNANSARAMRCEFPRGPGFHNLETSFCIILLIACAQTDFECTQGPLAI